MMKFEINKGIEKDTYFIKETREYYIGLHKNSLVPWLILVPKTLEVELFACEAGFKNRIRQVVDCLAEFSQDYFNADKMNIATIGNVVSQLHIHIVARKTSDFAWPEPVWGKLDKACYSELEKNKIISALNQRILAFEDRYTQ